MLSAGRRLSVTDALQACTYRELIMVLYLLESAVIMPPERVHKSDVVRVGVMAAFVILS